MPVEGRALTSGVLWTRCEDWGIGDEPDNARQGLDPAEEALSQGEGHAGGVLSARRRSSASTSSTATDAIREVHKALRHVLDRVRAFLTRRHKVPGRGTRQFSSRVVFRELGVVRLTEPRRCGS